MTIYTAYESQHCPNIVTTLSQLFWVMQDLCKVYPFRHPPFSPSTSPPRFDHKKSGKNRFIGFLPPKLKDVNKLK